MSLPESLPLGKSAQRSLERHWESAVASGVMPVDVRPMVRDSWVRALRTDVSPGLPRAPMVWSDSALHQARESSEWLPFARRAIEAASTPYTGGGHILTLFDANGRMLWSEGDPRALEGLSEINFRPGADWSENVVGTNGPGTALATGGPAHIVGAEHFCEHWHAWHCAAMPVRDPLTGEICGAVDISGFRDAAHPHTLTLTATLVVAVEQMLRAREAERRTAIMQAMMRLASRWPADTAIAVDRSGSVIGALHEFGASLTSNAAESTRRTLAEAVKNAGTAPAEFHLPIAGGRAIVYPVRVDGMPVGACLVIPRDNHPARETSRREVTGSRTRYSFHDLIGNSTALRDAIEIASAAAETELPVLLQGESGTGKELFAQGIHAAGRRGRKPFVVVNCAALPRELVESELFGYVGGAFSGARREGSIGKFEAANGGTIFLDEVAELPPSAQAALLRVLQEGEIAPVGSPHTRNADVRVIAATNRELSTAVAAGTFRSDLYYRLNVLGIDLPPLRDRVDDIDELARRFLAEASADLGRPDTVLNTEHYQWLREHSWPGNVRELKNIMHKVAALGPRILDQLIVTRTELPTSVPAPAQPTGLSPREQLIHAVKGARTMAEAAKRLGVTRSTLYRRMERFGLRPERMLSDNTE